MVVEDLEGTGMKVDSALSDIDRIIDILGKTPVAYLLCFVFFLYFIASLFVCFFKLSGNETIVEVIDVATQMKEKWALGDYLAYWKSPVRSKVMNIISLNANLHPTTYLPKAITPPTLVSEIDWVETFQGGNSTLRVDKYVLLSPKQSFTDFHVDFGGSSVWFYVTKGCKIFYLIPPTMENLRRFEEWSSSSPDHLCLFFGDQVNVCYELTLTEGQLMLMPGGWIHAVFTSADTISVAGNFLNSFCITAQLRVHDIENKTREKQKYLFPDFIRLNELAADHYLKQLRQIGVCSLLSFPPFPFCFCFFFSLLLTSSFNQGKPASPLGSWKAFSQWPIISLRASSLAKPNDGES